MAVFIGVDIRVSEDGVEGRDVRLYESFHPLILNVYERACRRIIFLRRLIFLSSRERPDCQGQ
jgi:hypothetical protein